jgi:hypothetical protein
MRRDCDICKHFRTPCDDEPCQSCIAIVSDHRALWEPAEPVKPPTPEDDAAALIRAFQPLAEAFNAPSHAPSTNGPAEPPAPEPVDVPCYVGFPDAHPEPGPCETAVRRVRARQEAAARSEPDPYHEAKHDLGKLRWDCLPWPAVEQVVAVLTFGAEKYQAWSWPTVPDARRRYFAATIRHAVAWLRGEKIDPESGLPHLAHLVCNALFLLSFDLGEAKPPAGLEEREG